MEQRHEDTTVMSRFLGPAEVESKKRRAESDRRYVPLVDVAYNSQIRDLRYLIARICIRDLRRNNNIAIWNLRRKAIAHMNYVVETLRNITNDFLTITYSIWAMLLQISPDAQIPTGNFREIEQSGMRLDPAVLEIMRPLVQFIFGPVLQSFHEQAAICIAQSLVGERVVLGVMLSILLPLIDNRYTEELQLEEMCQSYVLFKTHGVNDGLFEISTHRAIAKTLGSDIALYQSEEDLKSIILTMILGPEQTDDSKKRVRPTSKKI